MATEVCVIEGEDAAPEAIQPTVDILADLTDISFTYPSIDPHKEALDDQRVPEELSDTIERSDTVLFGSASGTYIPLIRYLRYCYGGGTFANVRPVRYIEGAATPLSDPEGIDYVIVRENLEGLYYLAEGELEELAEAMPDLDTGIGIVDRKITEIGPGMYAIRVITENETRKLATFVVNMCENQYTGGANESAKLTCGTKSNVLTQTDGLFQRLVEEEVSGARGIDYRHLFVDDLAQRLVTEPKSFDVIVMPNFAGDILSDLGAGTIGGLGLAPSGCYGLEKAYFEPVHGTAPDIAGENIINPTATMLSAVMMLEYLGLDDEAQQLDRAIEETYRSGDRLTPDQGGNASTTEFAEAITERL